MAKEYEKAVFGAGCFWCSEAAFSMVKGVTSVIPGYAGGHKADPTYEKVSAGNTGHIEVAEVTYDPGVRAYSDLLSVFFSIHDPTSIDRQGSDIGPQYRSAIFYVNDGQKKEAEETIKSLESEGLDIVTEVLPLEEFYPAEDYHKEYYKNHKDAPYCVAVIEPKLKKMREKFSSIIKE
jgi:peptide-methionine (S)-S-oxide reductase